MAVQTAGYILVMRIQYTKKMPSLNGNRTRAKLYAANPPNTVAINVELRAIMTLLIKSGKTPLTCNIDR